MKKAWVEDKQWDVAWIGHEKLGQGGQGVTRRVEHKEAGTVGCLKLLNRSTDIERRLRFSREATAYDTSDHPLIPRLLASNAHNHADASSKLFIVTEFIPGPTLTQRIEEGGALSWSDSLRLTIELLGAVSYVHERDWVHRDIKSDNIILRDGNVEAPVLLDFGLSYKEGVAETLKTEHWQEIGNRFLRLPELSSGSTVKRDERSDLAFVGGILFYVLTGTVPATLQDAEGKMPHQRKEAHARLSALAGSATPQLLDFFDRCFNPVIERRHSTAKSMQSALQRILVPATTIESSLEDDLLFIRGHLERGSVIEQQELSANCRMVFDTMNGIVKRLAATLGERYVHTQGGFEQKGASARTNLGIAESDHRENRFSPRWEIDVQGSEIVVRSSSDFLIRLDAMNPDVGGDFSERLKAHLVKGVRGLIETPAHQVIYRGFFRSTPFARLPEAMEEARRVNKNIFVVLFDDKHHQLSKLDHKLGYFMELDATKNLVHEHLVVAVVPVSSAAHLVSSGTLELARWFLLDKDGNVLDSQEVHANPSEGLKVVNKLVAM
jgi:serine/threonine-protein kinase